MVQFLIRAIVGDARLRYGQLPPPSDFMKLLQHVLMIGGSAAWPTLRQAAEHSREIREHRQVVDTTTLPEWWTSYRKDYLCNQVSVDGDPHNTWNASAYIRRMSGIDVGIPVSVVLFF